MTLARELDGHDPEKDELRAALRRTQAKLARKEARAAELEAVVYQAARDAAISYGPPKPVAVRKPAKAKPDRAESALLHATDWQYGKVTESYSPDVCEQRIETFVEKVHRIADIQRSDHPVEHAFVMLGGDMVEGVDIFPGQPFEVEQGLYDQLFGCARLIENMIRGLLGGFRQVTVYDVAGNHGRIGRKGQFPRSDNIDRMVYRIVHERFSGEDRVTWVLNDKWYEIAKVGPYNALLVHGDQVRAFGGNIPAYGLVKAADGWSAGGIQDRFADVFVGHFHQNMTLTLKNGHRLFVTGSPESDNVYAQEFFRAHSIPSQRLAFVHGDRITSEHVVWLD